MKKFLIMIVTVLFFIGCGGKDPKIKNMYDQPPKWYLKSEKMGYVTGVGSAHPNKSLDLNFLRSEAMLNARTDLAKNLKLAVRAREEQNIGQSSEEGSSIKKDIELRAESITKAALENVKVLNTEFGENGTLFIRLGVKTDVITGKAK